jgi:hypothetical protein
MNLFRRFFGKKAKEKSPDEGEEGVNSGDTLLVFLISPAAGVCF